MATNVDIRDLLKEAREKMTREQEDIDLTEEFWNDWCASHGDFMVGQPTIVDIVAWARKKERNAVIQKAKLWAAQQNFSISVQMDLAKTLEE